MKQLDSILETGEFATLPTVAAHVLHLLEDENVNIKQVATTIETDPALTIKILKIANSPIFASRKEITSVHQAIVILGLNRLSNVVLGVAIFSKFFLGLRKEAMEMIQKFWYHSSSTGIVAKFLLSKTNIQLKESEFIGGLLHDIGKLAMIQSDISKYTKVIDLVDFKGLSDIEAENEVFEFNHIDVGSAITKKWKLPSDLSDIICFHSVTHDNAITNRMIAIVRTADILCELLGAGFYEGLNYSGPDDPGAWERLDALFHQFREADKSQLIIDIQTELQKSEEFLRIFTGMGN